MATTKPFARDLTPCSAYGALLFGGPLALDTRGRGLVVDGWMRFRGWARIGVLVGRLRGMLDAVLERWVEEQPGGARDDDGDGGAREGERVVVEVVRRLVELEGMDR